MIEEEVGTPCKELDGCLGVTCCGLTEFSFHSSKANGTIHNSDLQLREWQTTPLELHKYIL